MVFEDQSAKKLTTQKIEMMRNELRETARLGRKISFKLGFARLVPGAEAAPDSCLISIDFLASRLNFDHYSTIFCLVSF